MKPSLTSKHNKLLNKNLILFCCERLTLLLIFLGQGEVLVKQGYKALGFSVVKPKVSFGLEKKGKENEARRQKVSMFSTLFLLLNLFQE